MRKSWSVKASVQVSGLLDANLLLEAGPFCMLQPSADLHYCQVSEVLAQSAVSVFPGSQCQRQQAQHDLLATQLFTRPVRTPPCTPNPGIGTPFAQTESYGHELGRCFNMFQHVSTLIDSIARTNNFLIEPFLVQVRKCNCPSSTCESPEVRVSLPAPAVKSRLSKAILKNILVSDFMV